MIISRQIPNHLFVEINTQLKDKYGIGFNDLQYFRLVWADDQFELQKRTHTDDGRFVLPQAIVKKVRKYQHITGKYVLEGLTIVPTFEDSFLVEELSYEPAWVFEDKNGNPLLPKWSAIVFILENIKNAHRTRGYTKYHDPEASPEEALEAKEQRIKQYMEDLFGNETETGTSLAHGEGIVVPNKEFN